MTTFVWSEKYGVGVKVLDEHHQKLFSLMNDLNNAMSERRGREVIGRVLGELFDYTVYHFGEEEKLMARAGSNGMIAHKTVHEEFISTLRGYKEKHDQGLGAYISTEVMVTLSDWIVNHINRLDKLYGESMHLAGIR